jgi:putative peptidoglycan lipid II flippase
LAGGIIQLNVFIGQIIASTKDGAIAVLQYADRIYQLPLGVVGVTIGVVLLPELSRALNAKRFLEAGHSQNRALEFALFLTLPASTALILISEEIVRVLYERGAFGAEVTTITARVLTVFGVGLPAFVMTKVFTPGYFAREDTRTPILFAAVCAAANLVLAVVLFPRLGEVGIAVALAATAWLNVAMLFAVLRRRGHFLPDAVLLKRVPRIVACCAILGASLFVGTGLLRPLLLAQAGAVQQVAALLLVIGSSGSVYLGAALLTGALDRDILRRWKLWG